MSGRYKGLEAETHTTNPKDYPFFKPYSMKFGNKPVDLSHKPSFMEVIHIILSLIPRSKVEEFLRNHTDNFFIDVTDRKHRLVYNETSGVFFRPSSNEDKIRFLNELFSFIRTPLKIKFRHKRNGNINIFYQNC